jgi:predicted rRNA methylase
MKVQAALFAVLVAVAGGVAAQPVKLKFAVFTPDREQTFQTVMKPFAEAVNKEAAGAVEIELYPNGALGRAPQQQAQMVLDGVTDPHNLGACLRSADAFGVHAAVAPRDRAASLNPVVRKVASGAAETVPFVQVTNLARTLKWLRDQGVWVVGAEGDGGEDLWAADLAGPTALVVGAEGAGMRRLTRESCDRLVRIPLTGTVASLNVSVATGVCLAEIARQRRLP